MFSKDKVKRIFFKRKITIVGISIIIIIMLISLFAPVLTSYSLEEMQPIERLRSPDREFWFGTDQYGRDVFTRIIYGGRIELIMGLSVVLFSTFFGVLSGTFGAYFKKLENIIMRMIDVVLAFPPLLLALALVAILGPSSANVILAVGTVYTARTARLTYSLTLKIISEPYIEASISQGASSTRILLKHIIPNLTSPLLVQASFTFAFSVLQIASLNFLGVGIPPGIPSWGNMLSRSQVYITRAPWLLIFPGIFIVLIVLAFNIIGDSLRDALDPKFQEEFN